MEDQNLTPSESEAGEIIASSQDIATEILLRLEASSVVNLKLVSKQWLSTTSCPTFILCHTVLHPPKFLAGLFVWYSGRPRSSTNEYVPFDPIDTKTDIPPIPFVKAQNSMGLNILQSCNGLLLCYSNTKYYICNPTTLQKKQLPFPKGAIHSGDFRLNLAFDPSKSTDYKVISVRRVMKHQSMYQLEVYSSKTGQWRTLGDPFWEFNVIGFKNSVFCRGSIHWLRTSLGCLYFHVDNEWMGSTPKPPPDKLSPELYGNESFEYFGESNGRLYLALMRPIRHLTLFQMEDDYSGWFTKCVVELEGLATKYPGISSRSSSNFFKVYEFCVLGIARAGCKDNDEDGEEIILCVPKDIVFFNTCTKTLKKIGDRRIASPGYKSFIVHGYSQTLCLV